MEGVRTTPAPTRGRGRGRGGGGASAGGPSKRGRGKKDTTGGGGRAAVGSMGGGLVGGAGGMDGMGGSSTMTDGCEDEGTETGEQAAAEKPAEMLRVGSLFIKSSIFDDVLTERKLELFDNPSVIEFLKKNRICS